LRRSGPPSMGAAGAGMDLENLKMEERPSCPVARNSSAAAGTPLGIITGTAAAALRGGGGGKGV
jgi:hypothetical protein